MKDDDCVFFFIHRENEDATDANEDANDANEDATEWW